MTPISASIAKVVIGGAAAADDERDQRDAEQHHGPRRLDEEVPERDEAVLDDMVADPARDLEEERVRVLDVVEHRLDPRQQPVARRSCASSRRRRRAAARRRRTPITATAVATEARRRRRRRSSVRCRWAGFVRSATASVTRSSAIAMTTMTMPARMRERRVGVQSADDDVAEALAADQPGDHHHREREDDRLVHGEQQHPARERELYFREHLRARRAHRLGRLDRVRRRRPGSRAR